ncbi:MAG TPA: hypothetical protein VNM69_03055 [Bacillus sp. (in: firmicutes)]|uniref:hypothetical protein n=1 Tax=Bacillus litorisediminis TaxID=2922713 RepID=UPI001FADD32B|nr:hypothetical protein [Bacillus litorisediminis]HWO74879.1 hypothetical protein [Bacillus sp. (in: firmicutes)]
MKSQAKMEVLVLPTVNGTVKVWVYGYQRAGDFGKAIAVYGSTAVTAKGYNRKKTIIRSLTKLNQLLIDQENGL